MIKLVNFTMLYMTYLGSVYLLFCYGEIQIQCISGYFVLQKFRYDQQILDNKGTQLRKSDLLPFALNSLMTV